MLEGFGFVVALKSDCVTLQFDLGHRNYIPNEASKGLSLHPMLYFQVYKENSGCDGSFVKGCSVRLVTGLNLFQTGKFLLQEPWLA